jgi:ABC-2 type transport system permease protein
MAKLLQWASNLMPLSYATDAFTAATTQVGLNAAMWRDAAVLLGCLLAAVCLASLTLRRRTP